MLLKSISVLIFISCSGNIINRSEGCMSIRRRLDDYYNKNNNGYSENKEQKNRLITPFLSNVLISPESCTGQNNNEGKVGVCVKKSVCNKEKGSVIGDCAFGYGTCCLHKTKCRSSGVIVVNKNNTHLINDESDSRQQEICLYEFRQWKQSIAQVRLDFIYFEITEGLNVAARGDCTEDTLIVSGARNARKLMGPLCGNLTGQHMYLDWEESNGINLEIFRKEITNQKWDILVTFIKYNSKDKAPNGCLQYYTGSRGIIKSFNFNSLHQLNNQEYSICIRTNPGMNRISYRGCEAAGNLAHFVMTGSPASSPATGKNLHGDDCVTDWLMILGVNKFCGNFFRAPVTTTSQPFILQVRFDDKEYVDQDTLCETTPPVPECIEDLENTGFCLQYTQSA